MGQPVTVIEKPSSRPGIVRFEVNRSLTGMGHERYEGSVPPEADTPGAEVARRLFERGGVSAVHVNGSVITVTMSESSTEGMADIIRDLFTHYRPGVPVPNEADFVDA